MIEIHWNRESPSFAETYVVAAEYGPGTGMFELMDWDWDGEKWETYPTVLVIGYLEWAEFKRQLQIKWPGEIPVLLPSPNPFKVDDEYNEM